MPVVHFQWDLNRPVSKGIILAGSTEINTNILAIKIYFRVRVACITHADLLMKPMGTVHVKALQDRVIIYQSNIMEKVLSSPYPSAATEYP